MNDVPKIHIERKNLANEIHCIVSTADCTVTDISILMQQDEIFSYFPTQKLTQEEIEKCEYIY